MRIGVDVSQTAFEGSGVARYTTMLAQSLLQYDSQNEYIFFYSSLRKPIPLAITSHIKKPHLIRSFPFPPTFLTFLWNDLHITTVERFIGNVDLFISSDWAQPPVARARSATIVHDLAMYTHPEASTTSTRFDIHTMRISPNIVRTQKKRLEWVKKETDIIISDSESTKHDLMRILDIPEKHIHVVYPAVEVQHISEKGAASVRSSYNLQRPYIFTVGKLEPRKNIQRLIEAFMISHAYAEADLVIVGTDGWGDSPINVPAAFQQYIRFLGYVPDQELFSLYKGALFFCYPSLYEGFGYPIIEAMAMGTPVATSSVSSMEELGRGYAILFNPHDIHDIAKALSALLHHAPKRTQLSQKAISYAQSFSKKRFAQELLDVFSSYA